MSDKQKIIKAVGGKSRILVAIDRKGVHFRKTLCVTTAWDTEEVRYDTKSIDSIKHPRRFRNALKRLVLEHIC